MVILAVVACLFGFLIKPRMTLPAFVATNFALVVLAIVAGVAMAMPVGAIVVDSIVVLVAAQAGYVAGLVVEIRRQPPRP
jgi:hypothetical protein